MCQESFEKKARITWYLDPIPRVNTLASLSSLPPRQKVLAAPLAQNVRYVSHKNMILATCPSWYKLPSLTSSAERLL